MINALVSVTRSDDDQGVEANALVELEFASPMPLGPVLTRDVVGDLVEKRSGNARQRRHRREFTQNGNP